MKTVNMKEIAKESGVSIATVSRVLNNSYNKIPVSNSTINKVLMICEKLKYEPNIHSKHFFTNKSESIGLIIPIQSQIRSIKNSEYTFTDYNLAELLSGIEESIRIKGYNLVLIVADEDFIKNKRYLRLIRNKSIDGILIWGVYLDDRYVGEIVNEGCPTILLNSNVNYDLFNFVGINEKSGSFQVTEHLINLGHKKIGYIRGPLNIYSGREREKGFKLALEKYGLNIDNNLVVDGDSSEESGYKSMNKLLTSADLPTSIVAENDYMAIGAMQMIKDAGLKIPDDIAVAGGDGILLSKYVVPSLTTFKRPMYELGTLGVEKLLEIIESKQKNDVRKILETELIIRESTIGKVIEK